MIKNEEKKIVMSKEDYILRLKVMFMIGAIIGIILSLIIVFIFSLLSPQDPVSRNGMTVLSSESGVVSVNKGAVVLGDAVEVVDLDTKTVDMSIETPFVTKKKMQIKSNGGEVFIYYEDNRSSFDFERVVDSILN